MMSDETTSSPITPDPQEKTGSKKPAPVFWLVPDDHGKPAETGGIPLHEAEQLNTVVLPVMPMYDLKVAAALIPMTDSGLIGFLQRNKKMFKARYRHTNRNSGHRVRVRLLSAAEIQHIRKCQFSGPGKDTVLPVTDDACAVPDPDSLIESLSNE
jgi:hypothetical protein